MTFGPFKIYESSDSFNVDKSMSHLSDIWSRRTFCACFFIFISSKRHVGLLDHVYTASELDLDCLHILNISQPNDR